jgi:mono/diheme cytochrome c family protein
MFTRFRGILLCLILTLAACGGGIESDITPDPTDTPFPTFEFVAPTNPPIFAEATATVEAADVATPAAELVERGRGRYEALECGTCHGANGEGTDEGSSLLEFAMNQADFISFMRSGGDIGTSHQYSTDRLSQGGSENLYLYLQSLGN